MLRRNVNLAGEDTPGKLSASNAGASRASRITASGRKRESQETNTFSWVLLALAIILTIATYMFPELQQVEQEAAGAVYRVEQEAEKEVLEWWNAAHAGQQPPVQEMEHDHFKGLDPTERMLQQPNSWVEGEKKLKAKLKVLAERQAQGLDIGVPVLTRWLGEDVPAWPGEGVDVEQWKATVAKKYEEMRVEEEQWIKNVKASLNDLTG